MENKSLYGASITGVGYCVPEKVLSNHDLEKIVETSDEWIVQRTGIKERRVLEDDQPSYKLAVEAATKAIKSSKVEKSDIGLVICTTTTPDYVSPSIASLVQRETECKKAAAFDMNAACSGFPYALTIAKQFINTGAYKHILIVSCEALSKAVDWKDRNTCVLFGDGAGACILSRSEDENLLASDIGCEGNLGHNITIPCFYSSEDDNEVRNGENKNVIWMDGGEVFKFAVKKMYFASKAVMKKSKLKIEDIAMVVPHQANVRIIDNAAKRLKIDKEKIYVNLEKYGNTSSASIPIALAEAYETGKIKKGDNIILVGFGAGLTWGATLIKWSME